MTQTTELKSIRAKKLEVGKNYIAVVWHTHTRRSNIEVTVKELIGNDPKIGMTVVTDKLTAEAKPGTVMLTEDKGKMARVTWKVATEAAKKDYPLVKIEEQVAEVKQEVKVKKVRKPLTAEQKARKNALARARRAAKKEAAKA